jgi:biofilm PGA synthesis protein PgaA
MAQSKKQWVEIMLRPASSSPSAFILAAILLLACLPRIGAGVEVSDASATGPDAIQAHAVGDARAGHYESAISALADLHRRLPDNNRYLNDYIEVLGWAGRDADVIALLPEVKLDSAPTPVLAAIGKSLRNTKQFTQAELIYRRMLASDPDNVQARIGLAYSVAESGRRSLALTEIDRLMQSRPRDPEVWFARGYVHEVTQSPVEALQAYQKVLTLDPSHREASRRRVLVIAKMGAPHLAHDLMQRQTELFSADDRFAIDADRQAIETRWGSVLPLSHDPRRRFDDTDAALAYQDKLSSEPWEHLDLSRKQDQRLAFDRMVALRDRARMPEVIGLYQQLCAAKVEIPTYSLIAAGDAYVYQQLPEKGVEAYKAVLAREPKNYSARLALFYAYTELDDFNNAYDVIDALAADEAEWLRSTDGKITHANPRKLESEIAATLGRTYADLLKEGMERFDRMHALAPANLDIRQELASVHRRRGWPRQSLHEYELLLDEDPYSLAAQVGRGSALFDRHRYPEAEKVLGKLRSEYPENKQVQRFARTWELYQRRELIVESRIGHVWNSSNGNFGQLGGDSIEVDSFLFSRPQHYFTRAYLHQHFATADFTEGTGTDHRLGVGAEYRQPDYLLAAEVGGGFADSKVPNAIARGTWEYDDKWSFSGVVDLNSAEVPLRGLRAGVDGNFFGVSAQYRWHESQAVRVGTGYLDFDDGNARNQLSAVFERRVIEVPHFHTTAFVEGSASRNERSDVIYYSPKQDASLGLTLDNEWVNYHRYERRFAQRLGLSLGGYWEENYTPDFTWGISYQHDWDFSDGCRLHYGIVHSRRVFDGRPEFETAIVAGLNVRF